MPYHQTILLRKITSGEIVRCSVSSTYGVSIFQRKLELPITRLGISLPQPAVRVNEACRCWSAERPIVPEPEMEMSTAELVIQDVLGAAVHSTLLRVREVQVLPAETVRVFDIVASILRAYRLT